jgi:hypothetical protein
MLLIMALLYIWSGAGILIGTLMDEEEFEED